MEDYEIVRMFQRYRHDIANHLQLVSGYLAMDRIEKVEEKVNYWIHVLEAERKLYSLDIPKTALWLLGFNANHESLRIRYEILLEENINTLDEILHKSLQSLTLHLESKINPLTLYDVFVTIEHAKDESVQVTYTISGEFSEVSELEIQREDFPVPIELEQGQTKQTYRFTLV